MTKKSKQFTAEEFKKFYEEHQDLMDDAIIASETICDHHSKSTRLFRKAVALKKLMFAINEEVMQTYKVGYYLPDNGSK